MLAVLMPSLAWAQAAAQRSAVVRITPGVPGKLPGTGFIVKLDGRGAHILTAAHVVEGDSAPKVEFFTLRDTQFTARVKDGADWGNPRGLALLIVDAPLPTGLAALAIDTDTRLEGEEPITAIGHPVGGGNWSVIPGSVTSRQGGVIYFAAQVDKGNSGGPLLHKGKAVGIVTNKGTFGEAVGALTMIEFLAGSGIDIAHAAAAATPRRSERAGDPDATPAPELSLDVARSGVVRIESLSYEGRRRVGTGFVVRVEADLAYIVTASHLVEGDPTPQIEFFARRNRPVKASVVKLEASDPQGLALLAVRGNDNLPADLHPLSFGPSGELRSGLDVLVIGFGQGLGDWAVVRASVASLEGRHMRLDGRFDEGSSGAPVLRGGRVVGLVVGSVRGFGLATPSLFVATILKAWGVDTAAP